MDTATEHRHYRRLPPSDQGVPGFVVGYCIKKDCPRPWVITPVSERVSEWDHSTTTTREQRIRNGVETRLRGLAGKRARTAASAT